MQRTSLTCSCGATSFRARFLFNEGVGLLACEPHGHFSLLLDSRDYWISVLQSGRPKEKQCKCRSRVFAVSLEYTFREDGVTVRQVDLWLSCVRCEKSWNAGEFEIDYGPTDQLVARPLDPIDDPWLRPRQIEIYGSWHQQEALAVALHLVESERLLPHLLRRGEPARIATIDELKEAFSREMGFVSVVFASVVLAPDQAAERDRWTSSPVVELASPFRIVQGDGSINLLYYMKWVDEVVVRGQVLPQPETFRACTARIRSWLSTQFEADRRKTRFGHRRTPFTNDRDGG